MTPRPITDTTQLLIPDELKPADGRFGCGPSKVRPEALARLAGDGAARDGHLAPADSPSRRSSRTSAPACASCSPLPDGYEVALGNGGATAFWDAAAFGLVERRALHLTYGEFSSKFATVTTGAPFLEDPVVVSADPGDAPDPGALATPGRTRRRRDLGAQRDLDRRDGPRGEAGRDRRRAGADRRDLRRRRAAGGRRATPTPTTSRRRRASPADGGLWIALLSPAAQERIAALAASERWIPAFLSLSHGAGELAQRPDVQHAGDRDPVPARRADPLDARRRRPGLVRRAHARVLRAPVRLGRAHRLHDAVRAPIPPSARSSSGTIDFAEEVDAAAVAATLRANGIVDVEPYRKLGRNQLRDRHVPRRRSRRRARADRVHRLDRRKDRVMSCRRSSTDARPPRDTVAAPTAGHRRASEGPRQGEDRRLWRASCCASASTSISASTGPTRSWTSGSAPTTAS